MKKKAFLYVYAFLHILALTHQSSQFCQTDGGCPRGERPSLEPEEYEPKYKIQRLAQDEDDETKVKNILKFNWPGLRNYLFFGKWEQTLLQVEEFINQVKRTKDYETFTDNPSIINFCNIHKLNLAEVEDIEHIEVRVHLSDNFGVFMRLNEFIQQASQRFLQIYQTYHDHYYGIFEFIACGENLFELLEDIASNIHKGKDLNPQDMQVKAQDVQDSCSIYSPNFSTGPWLYRVQNDEQYIPKYVCVRCYEDIFDLLFEFLTFEKCSNLGTCDQYEHQRIENIVKDIDDMFEKCIEKYR